jgi:hypothetical protein
MSEDSRIAWNVMVLRQGNSAFVDREYFTDDGEELMRLMRIKHPDAIGISIVRASKGVEPLIDVLCSKENHPDARLFNKNSRLSIYIIDLLCRPADREAVVGDLLELFEDIKKQHGEKRAEIWWRFQVFWTCTSLIGARLAGVPGIALLLAGAGWIWGRLSGG